MSNKKKRLLVTGGMRANAYAVLVRAVEEGVALGCTRAHKHTDTPSEDLLKQTIEDEVLVAICEVFEFDEKKEG